MSDKKRGPHSTPGKERSDKGDGSPEGGGKNVWESLAQRRKEREALQNAVYSRLSSLRFSTTHLDLLPKLLLFLSAVVYVTGLFVVNAWLGKFGYYSMDLIWVTYISAGFWCLLPPMFLFVLGLVPGEFLPASERLFTLKGWHKRLWVIAILWGLLFGFRQRLESLGFEVLDWGWLHVFSTGLVTFMLVGYFVPGVLIYFSERHFESRYGAAASFFFIAFALVGYLHVFAGYAYSLIPQRFGGGKPIEVRLLIAQEGARHLAQTFEVHDEGNVLTDPVPLLIETDNEYVLKVGASAVALKRDLVKLVIYQPEEKHSVTSDP